MILEPFKPTARQVVSRQLSEARRLEIEHAAKYELLTAQAQAAQAMVAMYQDRVRRLEGMIAESLDTVATLGAPA